MVKIMWTVAQEFLKRIPEDSIDQRVIQNPKAYHLDMFSPFHE
jgi:hypothetical protein